MQGKKGISKKPKMRLLRSKKKIYNKFFVFIPDDTAFEYNLDEWDVFLNEDLIEVEKKDGTEMDCFILCNVARVRFVHTDKKSSMQEVIQLKPVPPTDAA